MRYFYEANDLKVINFYGGAGIGKSTIAADIFRS
ncbi:NB-ARC domain-containing protein [Selenomonas sp. ND2010]